MANKESINNFEVGKEVAKELASDVYQDGIKPTIEVTGNTIALLPRTIKAVFAPLEKWVLSREYNIKETQKLLEIKLQNVSPDNIVTPEPHIAVPALQYISYCMDNNELRDMYAQLLANSMNKLVRNGVHPGFVEIIKQLTPDEAKILRVMKICTSIPTIAVKYEFENGGIINVLLDFSTIGEESGCEKPLEIRKYFDNMERLGLIERLRNDYFTDSNRYEKLENHSTVRNHMSKFIMNVHGANNAKLSKGIARLTSYGIQFCEICISK